MKRCRTFLVAGIATRRSSRIRRGRCLVGSTGGWQRVQAICDYVHDRIEFGYHHARCDRTASEGHEERIGVCRDFAHLAVTLCRSMNIPARYCTGYLGDIGVPRDPAPMDFSAWFEAFLDGRWYTFDARHNHPRIGRVVIARGRDAADAHFRINHPGDVAMVCRPPGRRAPRRAPVGAVEVRRLREVGGRNLLLLIDERDRRRAADERAVLGLDVQPWCPAWRTRSAPTRSRCSSPAWATRRHQ